MGCHSTDKPSAGDFTQPLDGAEYAPPLACPAPEAAEIEASLRALAGRPVAVALSGGVDSAVTALLLQRAGAEVIGLTAHMFDRAGGASQPEVEGARQVAEALGIPLHVIDARDRFDQEVVRPFVEDYTAGLTPNPCVRCNHSVKLDQLVEAAAALGCARLATGHYVRTARRDGATALFKGADPKKDQSYFLFAAPPEGIARLLFPLGARRKEEIRALGASLGIGLEARPESQEVCFVEDGRAGDFVAARSLAARTPGVIEDEQGTALGSHRGVAHYTIGQRRGLGVASARGPLYVFGIDAARARVQVGPAALLLRRELQLSGCSWLRPELPERFSAVVRIRYRHPGQAAQVERLPGGRARVCFDAPVRAVAPGQAAVCYLGDEVLGGGWIERPK